jgi:hypothetical protein
VPVLLVVGTWLVAFCTALLALIDFIWVGSPTLQYTINNRVVSRAYFLTHAVPLVTLIVGAGAVLFWAMWRERPWARDVMLLCCIAAGVAVLVGTPHESGWSDTAIAGAWCLAYVAAAAWYLYRKPNVVAYYERLRWRRASVRSTA